MNQTIVNEQCAVTMSFATIREDVNASGPGSRCLQVQIYEQLTVIISQQAAMLLD